VKCPTLNGAALESRIIQYSIIAVLRGGHVAVSFADNDAIGNAKELHGDEIATSTSLCWPVAASSPSSLSHPIWQWYSKTFTDADIYIYFYSVFTCTCLGLGYCCCLSLYILFLIHFCICIHFTLSRCGLSAWIKVLIDWLIDWIQLQPLHEIRTESVPKLQ